MTDCHFRLKLKPTTVEVQRFLDRTAGMDSWVPAMGRILPHGHYKMKRLILCCSTSAA